MLVRREFIGMKSVKRQINQVTCGSNTMEAFDFPRPWQARNSGDAHQRSYQASTDLHSHAVSEFCMHSTGTISATASSIYFPNETG
jgi:hypothetical protein